MDGVSAALNFSDDLVQPPRTARNSKRGARFKSKMHQADNISQIQGLKAPVVWDIQKTAAFCEEASCFALLICMRGILSALARYYLAEATLISELFPLAAFLVVDRRVEVPVERNMIRSSDFWRLFPTPRLFAN